MGKGIIHELKYKAEFYFSQLLFISEKRKSSYFALFTILLYYSLSPNLLSGFLSPLLPFISLFLLNSIVFSGGWEDV